MSHLSARRPARLGACLLALAGGAALHAADEPAASLTDAFAKGTFGGDLRYRLDDYKDDRFSDDTAIASTMRTALHYGTRPFHDLSGYVELYDNAVVGNDLYNDTKVFSTGTSNTNGVNRPFIFDPPGRGVNEMYGKFADKDLWDTTIKVGRQLFTINDEVFLTASRYRQNNDRYDAATVESHPVVPEVTLQYGYLWNNIDVSDASNPLRSQVGNVKYTIKDVGSFGVYGLLLRFRDESRATAGFASGDVVTEGIRIDGPFKIDDSWSVIYEGDIAKQKQASVNTAHIDAKYLLVHAGLSYKQWYLSAGYRRQSGQSGSSDHQFEASQLGYPWPWRGNTEQMVLTPAEGLKTIMVWGGGAIPQVDGLSFDLWYFKFDSDQNSISYGSEVSAALNYVMPFDKKWWLSGLIAKAKDGDKNNGDFGESTRAVFMTGYSF